MADKMSVDEEKKLITIKAFLKQIKEKQLVVEGLTDKKVTLAATIENLLIPLGVFVMDYKLAKNIIVTEMNKEETNDIYERDDLYKHIPQLIKNCENMVLMFEQINKLLAEFILDFMERVNIVGIPSNITLSKSYDDGTPTMTEDEYEEFKRRIRMLVMHYKSEESLSNRIIVAKRIKTLAHTRERELIADDIFLDLVGEKVLEKFSKKKFQEKQEEKPQEVTQNQDTPTPSVV